MVGPMSARDRDPRLGITPAQVAGSALAAISGAVVASWFGTTGTIIGAAAASMIATIGTEAYTWSLRRTGHAVRSQAVRARRRTTPPTGADEPPDQEVGEPPDEEVGEPPDQEADEPPDEETDDRRFPWPRVAVATAVVLLMALGAVTAFEAVTGRPVSSLLGRGNDSGTSLDHVVGRRDQQPTSPGSSPTPQPSPSASGSSGPSGSSGSTDSPLDHLPRLGSDSASSAP